MTRTRLLTPLPCWLVLMLGQRFAAASKAFQVLGCFGKSCSSYVIVSQHTDQLAYVFERDRGITAYSLLKGEERLVAQDVRQFNERNLRAWSWLVLEGSTGLLGCAR